MKVAGELLLLRLLRDADINKCGHFPGRRLHLADIRALNPSEEANRSPLVPTSEAALCAACATVVSFALPCLTPEMRLNGQKLWVSVGLWGRVRCGVKICMCICRFNNLFSNLTLSTLCVVSTCSVTLQMSPHQRSDVNKLISGVHSVYSANAARLQLGICEPRLNVEHKQVGCHRLPGTHTCNSWREVRRSEQQDETMKAHQCMGVIYFCFHL